MSIFPTVELRWFHSGTPPEAIADWFDRLPEIGDRTPTETREDLYLFLPGHDYFNLKLRQGRLEIKWRQNGGGLVNFGDRWQGYVEFWEKSICEGLHANLPSYVLNNGRWIGVEKTRVQRRYAIADDRAIAPISFAEIDGTGCNLELTKLAIDGQQWWTLALEAFGKAPQLWDSLEIVATHLSQTYPDNLHLSRSASFAYPKWLEVAIAA
jgi:hypothetical protein